DSVAGEVPGNALRNSGKTTEMLESPIPVKATAATVMAMTMPGRMDARRGLVKAGIVGTLVRAPRRMGCRAGPSRVVRCGHEYDRARHDRSRDKRRGAQERQPARASLARRDSRRHSCGDCC